MKKISILALTAIIVLLNSCVKDKHTKEYRLYYPEYATKQEVRDNVKYQADQPIKNMGGMALYNNYILASELGKGIHIMDGNSMTQVGFVPIPGNTGMAVRNNLLYADSYSDLFVIDISNLQQLSLVKVVEGVFQSRNYYNGFEMNGDNVVVDWIAVDTVVSADYIQHSSNKGQFITGESFFNTGGTVGNVMDNMYSGDNNSVGGSMARFTLVNNYMYTVDQRDLRTFDLSDGLNPVNTNTTNVSWDVETIYPFKDKLFIGSMDGMYMYSISNPAIPAYISEYGHIRTCDPVIANDDHAFVTLRSGTPCQGFTNQLDVLDISDINNPSLIKTYSFDSPHGLSMDNNLLFICDGDSGLKLLDATDVNNIVAKKTVSVGKATDVIAHNGKAIVITPTAIKSFAYTNADDIQLIGEISMQN